MGRRSVPKLPAKYKDSGLFGIKPVDVDVDVEPNVDDAGSKEGPKQKRRKRQKLDLSAPQFECFGLINM